MYGNLLTNKHRNFLLVLKISTFVPNKVNLRGIAFNYFILKKSVDEVRKIHVETYFDNTLLFQCFKNNNFNLRVDKD